MKMLTALMTVLRRRSRINEFYDELQQTMNKSKMMSSRP